MKRKRTIATIHPSAATTQRDGARVHRDEAYAQRDELLAALSVHCDAHLMQSTLKRLNWQWAVCLHLPEGQIAYTVPNDVADSLFGHLPRTENDWDGHDRGTRTIRLSEHVINNAPK